MDRRTIPSGSPFESVIGFSRAILVGDRAFVSGTAPVMPDGAEPPPDPYGQAKRCLQIIVAALRAAGAGPEDVVRTRTYLVDAADWQEVCCAHGEVFADVRPASTMVVVSGLLDPRWRVEIEADAILALSRRVGQAIGRSSRAARGCRDSNAPAIPAIIGITTTTNATRPMGLPRVPRSLRDTEQGDRQEPHRDGEEAAKHGNDSGARARYGSSHWGSAPTATNIALSRRDSVETNATITPTMIGATAAPAAMKPRRRGNAGPEHVVHARHHCPRVASRDALCPPDLFLTQDDRGPEDEPRVRGRLAARLVSELLGAFRRHDVVGPGTEGPVRGDTRFYRLHEDPRIGVFSAWVRRDPHDAVRDDPRPDPDDFALVQRLDPVLCMEGAKQIGIADDQLTPCQVAVSGPVLGDRFLRPEHGDRSLVVVIVSWDDLHRWSVRRDERRWGMRSGGLR